jgi:hypothetical protein
VVPEIFCCFGVDMSTGFDTLIYMTTTTSAATVAAVSLEGVTMTTITGHCAQCDRQVRVSEAFAFRGMDRLRATLACGHIVLRDQAGLK